MRGIYSVPTTVTLAAVPVTFRAGVLRFDLTLNRQGRDANCRWKADRDEAQRMWVTGPVNLNELLEKDSLRAAF